MYKSKILQHAGIYSKTGLSDTIDRQTKKPGRKVSVGKAVQAMVLNAFGFSTKFKLCES